MKTALLALAAGLMASALMASDANVLVIGSTHPYSSSQGVKPTSKSSIEAGVKTRLVRDMRIRGKLNIVFEDIYRTKTVDTAVGGGGNIQQQTYSAHSLAQWYFWPEGREERLASLQNKAATKWDAIVLIGDPSIIMNMPGVYAEGATLIINKIREGSAKPILFVPMSGDKEQVAEVVYRVGMSAAVPTVPAASPTAKKKISGKVFDTSNPFAMKYVDTRKITYHQTGSSSERGIEGAIKAAVSRCGVSASRTSPEKVEGKIDFNYGRANTGWEKNKMYKVNPKHFGRSYGFPMQDHSKTASESMLYGIDKRGNDGTDLGIAWDMINQNEVAKDIRCIPIRLMSAKLRDENPELKPSGDRWHMSKYLDTASGTFIYTLLSGRCPIDDKPSSDKKDALNHWLGQKIGYETAWRMSHVSARVPGFIVRPEKNGSLKVKFLYPPKANVNVMIAADQASAAEVSPKALTFTPENYNKAQTVTVKAKADAATFRVMLVSRSSDTDFNRLRDSWPYPAK